MTLADMKVGEAALVCSVGGPPALRLRLLQLGFTAGTEVVLLGRAPFGDPIELWLRTSRFTVRRSDAALIEVRRGRCGSCAACLGGKPELR